MKKKKRQRKDHLWHVIAETYSTHGDEDKIEALEEAPFFRPPEYSRADEDVNDKDKDGNRDR